jgi:hypothetical protein
MRYLFLLFLTFTHHALPQTNVNDLKSLQEQYKQILLQPPEERNQEALIKVCRDSYNLGLELYGKPSKASAQLAINYALALGSAKQGDLGREILINNIKNFELAYGEFSYETGELHKIIVDFFGYADQDIKKHAKKARNILKRHHDNTDNYPNSLYTMGISLSSKGFDNIAFNFLDEARVIFSEKYSEKHPRIASIELIKGRELFRSRKHKDAEIFLRRAVKLYNEMEGANIEHEEKALTFLIKSLQQQDKFSETSEFNRRLARIYALKGKDQYTLIIQNQAMYPKSALKKNRKATVITQFDLSTDGLPLNIEVISSTNGLFNKSAIESTKSAIYTPQIKNGEFIQVPGVRIRHQFKGIRKELDELNVKLEELIESVTPKEEYPTTNQDQ